MQRLHQTVREWWPQIYICIDCLANIGPEADKQSFCLLALAETCLEGWQETILMKKVHELRSYKRLNNLRRKCGICYRPEVSWLSSIKFIGF